MWGSISGLVLPKSRAAIRKLVGILASDGIRVCLGFSVRTPLGQLRHQLRVWWIAPIRYLVPSDGSGFLPFSTRTVSAAANET